MAAGSAPSDPDVPPAAPAGDPPPMTARSWYTVIMLAVILMLSHIDRGVIALLVQPIKADLRLTDTQIGLLIGFAFSSVYVVFGLPLSRLADHGSRKLILTLGLGVWSLATAASAMANSFAALLVARGMIGAGESVQAPNSLSLLSNIVPRQRLPRAFSIYSMGGFAGLAGSMIIGGTLLGALGRMPDVALPLLGVVHDWQMVFLLCGLPGLAVALLFWLTVKEPPRPPRAAIRGKSLPGRDVIDFLRANRRLYVPLYLGASLWSIEALGMSAWRIAFFERTHGWGPQIAGPLFGLLVIVSTPVGLAAGASIGEYFDRKGYPDAMMRLYVMSHAAMLPLAIAVPLVPNPWVAIVCAGLVSFFMGVGHPGQNSAIQIIAPPAMRGQLSWLFLFFVSIVGSGLGPTVVAFLTDYVFQDERQLRYAMALTSATLGPLGLYLSYRAMTPYGERVAEIIAGENALPSHTPSHSRSP